MFVQRLTGSCKTRQNQDMLPTSSSLESLELTTGSPSERASCVGLHVCCKTQPCQPQAVVGVSPSLLLVNLLCLPACSRQGECAGIGRRGGSTGRCFFTFLGLAEGNLPERRRCRSYNRGRPQRRPISQLCKGTAPNSGSWWGSGAPLGEQCLYRVLCL